MRLLDRLLGRTTRPSDAALPGPNQPSGATAAREPYRDAVEEQLTQLAASHPDTAATLRAFREEGRDFSLDTDVWLAADVIWTIVREAWPDEEADAFFAVRDEAELRLNEMDSEIRDALRVVVNEVRDNASTSIRGSAMIGSMHLDADEQVRADDRAMWRSGGAHHVAHAAALERALGDQLDEASRSRLALPWSALRETTEEDRWGLIAAAEEGTLDAIELLAADHILMREADQPRTALVRLLEPFRSGLEGDDETAGDEDRKEKPMSDEGWDELPLSEDDEPPALPL